jgi:predicted nucleic acid-binding protein
MGLILDSDHLIAAEKQGLTAYEALQTLGLKCPDEEFAISVISVAELRHGIERSSPLSRRLSRQTFLDELLSVAFIQPVTTAIALLAGELDAKLERDGRKLDMADLLIGCTALKMEFAVATKNRNHFERIPGLRLVNLISPAGY